MSLVGGEVKDDLVNPPQVMILVGGAFERGNIIPTLIFGFCWATIVYCPLAHWTWDSSGWLYNLPSLDFAGGGPVHIASGWSALAYALLLGKRKAAGKETLDKKAHNPTLVFLGASLIWAGWFGFNGGTALNSSIRAMLAIFNTNAAASSGVIGWCLVDFVRYRGKFSSVGACEGAIAGLVGITPAAGLVSVWLAVCIGFIAAIICSLCKNVNEWLRIDEGLDVFKLHGIGGMVGSFLTGIFASAAESMLDGETDQPGGIDGNGVQVGKFLPGWMSLRVSEEAEQVGLDSSLLIETQIGDWNILSGHGTSFEEVNNNTTSSEAIALDSTLDKKASGENSRYVA